MHVFFEAHAVFVEQALQASVLERVEGFGAAAAAPVPASGTASAPLFGRIRSINFIATASSVSLGMMSGD